MRIHYTHTIRYKRGRVKSACLRLHRGDFIVTDNLLSACNVGYWSHMHKELSNDLL